MAVLFLVLRLVFDLVLSGADMGNSLQDSTTVQEHMERPQHVRGVDPVVVRVVRVAVLDAHEKPVHRDATLEG